MKFPETLIEFQEQFPDEAACWKALRRLRWPHGFECPRCGHRKSYPISAGRSSRPPHGIGAERQECPTALFCLPACSPVTAAPGSSSGDRDPSRSGKNPACARRATRASTEEARDDTAEAADRISRL